MKFDRLSAAFGAVASAFVVGLFGLWGSTAGSLQAQPISGDPTVAELQRRVQELDSAAQRAQVITVVYQLDTAGLHDIDESLQAGSIPSGALGRVRRARIVAQSVMWPDGLRTTATQLVGQLTQLESALRDEDVERARGPAHAAHDGEHDVSDQAYAWLAASPAIAAPSPSTVSAPGAQPSMPAATEEHDDHDHDDHSDHSH